MTKDEAIKYLQQLYPNGGHCWLDEQRIEAIGMAINALQKEPAPKILEDMLNAKTPAESLGISAEEHDKIIDICLYGKEPEMVDIDDLPKEEPVSEDLEEAADSYIKTHGEILGFGRKTFKAGSEWKEKQMMAKAIDGTARPDDNEIWCNLASSNLKDGDKVKVIVIKED